MGNFDDDVPVSTGYSPKQQQQNQQQPYLPPQQPYYPQYQAPVPSYQQQQQPIYSNQPYQQPYYSAQPQPQQQYNAHAPLLKKGDNINDIDQIDIHGNQHEPIEGQYVYEDNCQKFPEAPKYQDVLYTILFVLHLVGLGVIFGVTFTESSRESFVSNFYGVRYERVLIVIGVSSIVSLIYVMGWLRIAAKHAKGLINFTFLFNLALCVVTTVFAFIYNQILLGVLFLISTILTFFWYLVFRKRIDFSAALLTSTIELLQRFPSAFKLGYISLFVNIVWLFIWSAIYFRIYYVFDQNTFYGLSVYMVFSFYWVANVMKNVVHTTISGLFASWYFLEGTDVGMPENPTLKSFKRTMTTSFGSICFGSLLVAIITTLRYLAQQLMNSDNNFVKFIGCLINCFLAIFQSIIEFFNIYAYTQVAIYGKSYCEAAKDTFQLFKHRCADIIINDDFISTALSMSVFFGAIVGGIIGGIVSYCVYGTSVDGLFTFFTTLTFVLIALEVVYSGVVSTIVCFLMEPKILKASKPEIYQLYTSTYKKIVL
ncbi:hypothetical protein SAMD00019534_061800 [Acytostelium subglobosum LB1]|uniref:hypothetical protein n=1 Tax=Acytostelium subglobosum LB1 TaxID=1410327 RepID=UPI000645166F|nr:hypothetical protein SAMD00019534_061800 [Acytostelium subglobosum LB1]GAM23005.1 hypothetical protein SAMD00019534_061800 [Acytostelium subglobosum LB1]|eukprot:XP_012754232.1 hypothetical protein SAMD00019534_061800 [Acytostelium subglobosum LB1]